MSYYGAEEKKAKEKALQATRERGEKQQKDAAKAREDRKKQEQVKVTCLSMV